MRGDLLIGMRLLREAERQNLAWLRDAAPLRVSTREPDRLNPQKLVFVDVGDRDENSQVGQVCRIALTAADARELIAALRAALGGAA